MVLSLASVDVAMMTSRALELFMLQLFLLLTAPDLTRLSNQGQYSHSLELVGSLKEDKKEVERSGCGIIAEIVAIINPFDSDFMCDFKSFTLAVTPPPVPVPVPRCGDAFEDIDVGSKTFSSLLGRSLGFVD